MSGHIQKLILEGEHQQLDFKFEISDSKRIARSLTAFANTDGGRLLVGVKDNGAIAGVRSDEEIHMIEAASQLYCQPEVPYTTKEWEINGKLVLEVIVPKSTKTKHRCPDKNNQYKIYIRVKDKNIIADSILLKIWKKQKSRCEVKVMFTDIEMQLLRYLSENKEITLADFRSFAHVKKEKAEAILIDFVLMGVITMEMNEKETTFSLTDADYVKMNSEMF